MWNIKPEFIAEIKRISKEKGGKEMSDEAALKGATEIYTMASIALEDYFKKEARDGLQGDGHETPTTGD